MEVLSDFFSSFLFSAQKIITTVSLELGYVSLSASTLPPPCDNNCTVMMDAVLELARHSTIYSHATTLEVGIQIGLCEK